MHNASIKEIGDRRKADVGVWAHIHALSGKKLYRSHLVEEDKRTDQLTFLVRHGSAHGKAVAQVAHTWNDDQLERIA
jgi:hypothetical protein